MSEENGNGRYDPATDTRTGCLPRDFVGPVHRVPNMGRDTYVRTPEKLSATERETERLAMRDQIVALTKQLARQQKAIDGLLEFDREQDRRIDAIERGTAVLSAWLRRPLWERVKARLGL